MFPFAASHTQKSEGEARVCTSNGHVMYLLPTKPRWPL
jgi:hypothetical protein